MGTLKNLCVKIIVFINKRKRSLIQESDLTQEDLKKFTKVNEIFCAALVKLKLNIETFLSKLRHFMSLEVFRHSRQLNFKMYPGKTFRKLVCSRFSNAFDSCSESTTAATVNIWKVPYKHGLLNFLQILHTKLTCEDFFLGCFWFSMMVALVGFFEALFEFVKVYSNEHYIPNTFWNRDIQHIPIGYRRNGRIVGAAVNIITCLLFLCALASFSPSYIYPWLVLNFASIMAEALYWITNSIYNKRFGMKPLLSIAFLILRFAIVYHLMLIMKDLIL